MTATSSVSLSADIPASSDDQLLVFPSLRHPPPSSKLYLPRLAEDSLGVSITRLGQRDNSMESSSHPPAAGPQRGAKILGQGIVLVKATTFRGRQTWVGIPMG